ncbi:MAG: hypothetical protein LBT89_07595 [Planctomycetaceae bacterium]|jgi:hypothetical protein|nr:hypothetical protein [Planctomycetaceae bacterium]
MTFTRLVILLAVFSLVLCAAGEELPTADNKGAGTAEIPVPPAAPVLPYVPAADKAMLRQMQKQLTFELQQTQRTLNFVDPNDKQLREALETGQASLVKHLKDIETQLSADVPGKIKQPEPALPPQAAYPGALPVLPQPNQINPWGQLPQEELPSAVSLPFQNVPNYGVVTPAVPLSPWQQNSKELTELKTSVESLRQEVGELKSVVKALETQIQLLNRTILLSDRVKEN